MPLPHQVIILYLMTVLDCGRLCHGWGILRPRSGLSLWISKVLYRNRHPPGRQECVNHLLLKPCSLINGQGQCRVQTKECSKRRDCREGRQEKMGEGLRSEVREGGRHVSALEPQLRGRVLGHELKLAQKKG